MKADGLKREVDWRPETGNWVIQPVDRPFSISLLGSERGGDAANLIRADRNRQLGATGHANSPIAIYHVSCCVKHSFEINLYMGLGPNMMN